MSDENERLRMALAIALDEYADDGSDVAAEFTRCIEAAEAVLSADTHEGDCTGVSCTCLVCYGERLAYEMPGAITNERPDYDAGFRAGIEAAMRLTTDMAYNLAEVVDTRPHPAVRALQDATIAIRNLKPEDGA